MHCAEAPLQGVCLLRAANVAACKCCHQAAPPLTRISCAPPRRMLTSAASRASDDSFRGCGPAPSPRLCVRGTSASQSEKPPGTIAVGESHLWWRTAWAWRRCSNTLCAYALGAHPAQCRPAQSSAAAGGSARIVRAGGDGIPRVESPGT
eukprot:scaffold40854_cov34-Tisochrysis_lutea.AAC.3